MSAFLAPIHYWLYKKIRLVIQREQMIYDKAREVCGLAAEESRAQVWQTYGEPLPDVDLAQLIDQSNIHGWLQRQINIAESSEAAFIKDILDMCSDSKQVVEEVFYQHGLQCGEDARGKFDVSGALGIYKALNDYYLNGMPCDQADKLVEETMDKVVWESSTCLQEPNWKRVGIAANTMKAIYQKWLEGFIKGVNSQFEFRQTADTLKGNNFNMYEIRKIDNLK